MSVRAFGRVKCDRCEETTDFEIEDLAHWQLPAGWGVALAGALTFCPLCSTALQNWTKCGPTTLELEEEHAQLTAPAARLKCTCGYHGEANADLSCPHCGEVAS